MKYNRINEKKWATIILLEKIRDIYSFEVPHDAEEWDEKDSYSISEFVLINGKNYKIEHNVFVETLTSFETKGLIKLLDYTTFHLNEIVDDPLGYAFEELQFNKKFSEQDLEKDDVFEYEIVIKNLNAIKKKITELNSSGVEIKILESRDSIPLSLASEKIVFDDKKAQLIVGNKKIQLPPAQNEHSLCRLMFEYQIGEFVDWSTAYESMMGEEPAAPTQNRRSVLDAMYAVNKRISGALNTKDKLFIWKGKSIKRNF